MERFRGELRRGDETVISTGPLLEFLFGDRLTDLRGRPRFLTGGSSSDFSDVLSKSWSSKSSSTSDEGVGSLGGNSALNLALFSFRPGKRDK